MNRLLIVGALVLLILIPTLVCFGIMSMMTPFASSDRASPEDILEAQGTIHSFLDDLRNSNFENAYSRTSGSFKGRQSLEQFQAWAEKYPQLTQQTDDPSLTPKSGAKPTAIKYDVVLAGQGSSRFKLNLEVIKDGDAWKVDAVSVQ